MYATKTSALARPDQHPMSANLALLLLLLQFEENDEYLNGKQLLKKRLDLYTLAEYSISVGQRPVWMCRVCRVAHKCSTPINRATVIASLRRWRTSCTAPREWRPW